MKKFCTLEFGPRLTKVGNHNVNRHFKTTWANINHRNHSCVLAKSPPFFICSLFLFRYTQLVTFLPVNYISTPTFVTTNLY